MCTTCGCDAGELKIDGVAMDHDIVHADQHVHTHADGTTHSHAHERTHDHGPVSYTHLDVYKRQGHWLGVVITPWCMSLLLVPGSESDWVSTGDNGRRFIRFSMGDFAFLGSDEPELGEYQSCPLISPMERFSTQSDAVMTARASMLGLLAPPQAAKPDQAPDEPSLSRRRFLALGRSARR